MPGGAESREQQYEEYSYLRQLIFQQLIIFCGEFKQAQLLKLQQLKLKEQETAQSKQAREMFWEQIQYFVGSFSTVVWLLIIGITLGITIGINIPNGAGCTDGNLLCQHLRWRQPKVDF